MHAEYTLRKGISPHGVRQCASNPRQSTHEHSRRDLQIPLQRPHLCPFFQRCVSIFQTPSEVGVEAIHLRKMFNTIHLARSHFHFWIVLLDINAVLSGIKEQYDRFTCRG